MRRIVQCQTTTIQITSVEITWVGERQFDQSVIAETAEAISKPPATQRKVSRKQKRKSNPAARDQAGPDEAQNPQLAPITQ